MEWNDLINSRYTNFAWKNKDIPQDILEDVCKEVYYHVPTKNLKFPYVITVYRNNDPEIKKEIATICHRNKDKTIAEDLGNPQVLAPVLFAFSRRNYKDLETKYQKTYTWTEEQLDKYGMLEIGVVATFLILALTNRGIQTGFCQNVNQNQTRASEIFDTEYPVRLLVGAGYTKGPGRHIYIDPRTDKPRKTPYDPEYNTVMYPRPPFETIFKFK